MSDAAGFFRAQYDKYPLLTLQDLLKGLYQSAFGPEHLVTDVRSAADLIRREAAAVPESDTAPEPLNGPWCRVPLSVLREGMRADTLAALFVLSAETPKDGCAVPEEDLRALCGLCERGELPFSPETAQAAAEEWRRAGYPALHHSEAFRAAYAPAYRLIRREYVPFLPLFSRVDCMLEERPRALLAIEGPCASGKTTLAELLRRVYGCAVFHMDDFFLRPEQRTPERYREPGGNVDRERFLDEVLGPVSRGETAVFRRFDCAAFRLAPPETVPPARLSVVEGAYSMHPELAGYYDPSVFLRISPEARRARILRRNGPEGARPFFERWIPLEQAYFDAADPESRCALVIDVD